ncbi:MULTISPECIES: hypothetical protein [unclassified Streptomyces]|uniref:hypothetical protein n=1 Tax=unclassified Streptomyces TaxID=2593676 RepID=UPI002E2F55E0|nr:hypothetical protein [Streptomyces sp. NBC_01268]
MAGFRSLARQVRDPGSDTALRRYSLRKCLERFAPYGHRATWDHLCRSHGFGPEDREADPGRLVAALDELEQARAVWLAYEAEFAERRRREKHGGLRRPGALDEWHRRIWGGNGVARCDDPARHPQEPLPEVVGRLVAALKRGPGDHCPVCAGPHIEWRAELRDEPWFGPVCEDCGVLIPRAVLTSRALARTRGDALPRLASVA